MTLTNDLIAPLRAAQRQLVRELKVIGGEGCCAGLNLSECHLLTEIDLQGVATVSALADALVLEKSTVSRACQALTQRGCIEAQASQQDRRRRPYGLTAKGRAIVQQIHEYADEQVKQALAFVPSEERQALLAGLDRYARALRCSRLSSAFHIRPLRAADDPAVAGIIRRVMTEFGAVGCGYSIQDPEVAAMSEAFRRRGAAYFVVTRDDQVLGGGGVAPLSKGEDDVCELQKMYFLPALRGIGMGTRLLHHCLHAARLLGYRRCYLETLESMHQARHVYRKMGFRDLDAPLGDTGHFRCNRWMVLELG